MAKLYEADKPKNQSEAKDVSLWLDRINIAKKAQEDWAESSGAKRFIKEYKGDYGIVFNTRNRKVPIPPINDVFSYVQSDIAATYNRDPYITVNPEAGTPRGAAFWEVILNYWWRKLKIKEELEYEILDKDLIGYAWHKVGYSIDKEVSGQEIRIKNEQLYSSSVRWRDVVWNINSKRPGIDSEWMAQRIVEPLNDMKEKYKNAKGLEGVPNPEVDNDIYKKSMYKDDIKVGVKWEIWDRKKKKVYLVAEGLKDRYLEDPKPWPDYIAEFPFLMYWDFLVPDSDRPMSAISPWEAQVLSKMVILGSAINHVKRWNRQAFVKNGTIDENSLDKYERGDDGAIITFNGETADIKFADFGQLPTDFYLLMDRLQSIQNSTNGQPEFARGGVTKTTTRTIGELNLIDEGHKSRQDRKIDRLETHLENIARQMLAHLKANFDFEQSIRVTGDTPLEIIQALGDNFDPVTKTVKFTPKDIEGEYDVDIKSGSTLPMDKQNRMKVMEIILNTVAQAAAQGPMSHFMNTLIQELLKDYEIKSLQEAYDQDIQEYEQAKAQQQQQQSVDDQKVQAETAKREAQAQNVSVDTVLKSQEAQVGPMLRAQLKKMEKHAPNVGESISYKDLPESGRVQMAEQAGIHLESAPLPVTNGTPK